MIGLTPASLLALANKHWTDNPTMLAATMLSCKATLADLVDAAQAAGYTDIEHLVADMLHRQQGDANWRELGAAWHSHRSTVPPPDADNPPALMASTDAPVVMQTLIAGVPYRITIERVQA